MTTQRQNIKDTPCGCYMHIDPDPDRTEIRFCPTHAAAPEMLEALKKARPDLVAYSNSYGGDYLKSLRLLDAAIAIAKENKRRAKKRGNP